MKTFNSPLDAVRSLREQQEQLVLKAYGKALEAVAETSRSLHCARSRVEDAVADIELKRQAGASENELSTLDEQIDLLKRQRREAEQQATLSRRETEQAMVSVLSARRACAVISKYSEAQKSRIQKRSQTELRNRTCPQKQASSERSLAARHSDAEELLFR